MLTRKNSYKLGKIIFEFFDDIGVDELRCERIFFINFVMIYNDKNH